MVSSTRNGLLNALLYGLFNGLFPFSVVSSVSSHLVSSRLYAPFPPFRPILSRSSIYYQLMSMLARWIAV